MANRLDYYFRQRVTEQELDNGFEYLEVADRALMTDTGRTGIMSGLTVAQQGVPNMTVAVALGVAYDPLGERVAVAGTQTVDCSQDSAAVTTAVAGVGNEKWLSITLLFDRLETDPRTDGNGLTVYFSRAETFVIEVTQGVEAGAGLAVRPSLDPNGVLLADVKLVFGSTSVTTAMISTTRRQDSIVSTSVTPRLVRRGLMKDAVNDLITYYNNHVLGSADKHPAADINYAGGPAWADAVTNPAASVEAQLDKIITELTATGGAGKIGSAASGSLTAGTIASQLAQLGAGRRIMSVGLKTPLGTGAADIVCNAGVWTSILLNFISFPGALVGDDFLFFANFEYQMDAGASVCEFRLAATENGGAIIDCDNLVGCPNPPQKVSATLIGTRIVQTAGTFVVQMQVNQDIGGAGNEVSIRSIGGSMIAVHLR